MKKIYFFIIIVLFIGCSARVDYAPMTVDSKYAPINSSEQYGMVSYLNEGIEPIRKARREDAYKKMYKICKGRYKIVSISDKPDGVGFLGNTTSTGFTSGGFFLSHRIYIKFQCVK